MIVKLLYFAAIAERAGTREEDVSLPPDVTTVAQLRRWLGTRAPLADALAQVRFARNEAFADDAEPLAEGDVVALIPPVAGG